MWVACRYESVERDGGGNGVGRAHLAGDHVLDVAEEVGLGFARDGVLHSAGNGGDVGVGEEEQDVGLGAGLKVGQDLGLPLLVGGGGAVVDLVAGGGLIGLDGGLKAAAVAVVAAVRGDDIERHVVGSGDSHDHHDRHDPADQDRDH